ncbi:MAG: sulfatase-like hydrolase/transferase [Verrucomicrobiota bacterium]
MRLLYASLLWIFAVVAHAEKPNVVLILADDMALEDLSSLNSGLSRTPNLDTLKSSSVWLSRAYSASPVCAPARAALLTGRFPHRTGAVTLNMKKHPKLARIQLDETTITDVFRANGYKIGLIGKWHSGLGLEYHPLSRGFDEFEGFIGHLYVPSYFDFKLDIGREIKAFPNRYLTTDLSNRAASSRKTNPKSILRQRSPSQLPAAGESRAKHNGEERPQVRFHANAPTNSVPC